MPTQISSRSARSVSPSRLRRVSAAAMALPAFFAVACVTVNIYFPAPEIREAAEQIVEETWGGTPAATPKPGKQSRALSQVWLAALQLLTPSDAMAAGDVDVNVSTAAIRSLKESMKQRSSELKPYLTSGAVGIDKGGMLTSRDAAGLDLATKAKVRRLVDAENKDREALYAEIASANNYGSERVNDIRSIFAKTWKDKAESGWWVQGADGAWKKK